MSLIQPGVMVPYLKQGLLPAYQCRYHTFGNRKLPWQDVAKYDMLTRCIPRKSLSKRNVYFRSYVVHAKTLCWVVVLSGRAKPF